MNYTINNNYNDTNYIRAYVPQPPMVQPLYPSAPIGYECSRSDTDTDSDSEESGSIVIIDIVQ